MRRDSYKLQGLRKHLVDTLRQEGIRDEKVLAAIAKVPRHLFLEKAFEEWAYKNVAFPIGCDQTISQPLTVAIQSGLLEIKKGDKVLEVGTGSGYQACILSELGAKVYTIERQSTLYERTEKFLNDLGYRSIRTFLGDGYLGLPMFAPFDKILVTAGASALPETLISQLAVGGHLVIPIGDDQGQTMWRYTLTASGEIESNAHGKFKFVPFLKGIQ
ncbi:MAG: protein-L-isoaspartate(D-aspartate) O-methyltransferase [Saprospiraceae bacterium]|uniref:Protein-L-isoaspartate O-methyltransferase n=1 Tax=Candidatus Opimibacter skivensis TaxID=2982028 RepID=A0A9D7XSC9_9BACT|nr:protein-L-isoaspartate(D-aspartate) O-methyltransferase [Candidatus Opimibacter skivensis]